MRFFLYLGILLSQSAFASESLVIHASEFGIGKFHRYDNLMHEYPANNIWKHYILPKKAKFGEQLILKNEDGSYSIFFDTLESLLRSVAKVSKVEHKKVYVLNIEAHGVPGAQWFPKNKKEMKKAGCETWREAVQGKDKQNYEDYYEPTSVEEIMETRRLADAEAIDPDCTVGLIEWRETMIVVPEFRSALSEDIQVHFFSCNVGLGRLGEIFTKGLAQELFPAGAPARIQTTLNYGLGDWSMPTGMGFWDYQSDEQVKLDNQLQQEHKSDIMVTQKGLVRTAVATANGWETVVTNDVDYMLPTFDQNSVGGRSLAMEWSGLASRFPNSVRVPKT